MKKILVILILSLSFLVGCEKSLDIPKIEGTYESTSKSSLDGEILSTTRVIVTKIGKNKYSLKGEYEGFSETVRVYQEVEVLEVLKDHEKYPTYYNFKVRELKSGEGTRKRKDYLHHPEDTKPPKEFPLENISNLTISEFSFKPKSPINPSDEIYFSFKNLTIFVGNRIK